MRTFSVIALLLLACTKENDPKDATDTGSTDVLPTGGNYTISSTLSSNGCSSWGSSFNDSIDGFSLKITFPEEDTALFHWVNEQECARDGASVTCSTDELLLLDDYAPDNDARIMYEDLTRLTWQTPDSATGSWTVDLSCEGEQCDLIAQINDESYPCTIVMSWSLARQE
jgi:hypothetical protein